MSPTLALPVDFPILVPILHYNRHIKASNRSYRPTHAVFGLYISPHTWDHQRFAQGIRLKYLALLASSVSSALLVTTSVSGFQQDV